MKKNILDGQLVASKIRSELKAKISRETAMPNLVAISAGENAESEVYLKRKKEAASEVGIIFTHLHFNKATTEKIVAKINELNSSPDVHGIMVQLPLPEGVDTKVIAQSIAPWKDVDAFHPYNKGLLDTSDTQFISPTAMGVMKLLEFYKVNLKGMNAVVVGAGEIAGKPTSKLLMNAGATVTVCNSDTKDITAHTKGADIVVSAVGKKNLLNGKDFKEGAIIINIGMTREEGKIFGDVEFESASKVASLITPTPGGTGPMTVALLMANTYLCYNLATKMNK